MMPRLGERYKIDIESIEKPKNEYLSDEYFELDLPVAPAIMVGEEIVVEGTDVTEEKLDTVICRQLGLQEPKSDKERILRHILKK
jgi:hypothetical protein